MTTQSDIREKIKAAMVEACNDMLDFTDEPSKEFNAEYLFTVCSARSINKLNGPPADPYKIYVERNARKFSRDCLMPVKFGHPMQKGSTVRRKGFPDIERNGRIDIAVYHDKPNSAYFGLQPLCAIELKGFNPQRKYVVADLKRNLEFLRVSGATGKSVLDFTLFAALLSFKKSSNESHIEADIQKTKSLYAKWISEVGSVSDIDVDAFTVRKELVGRVLDEGEYQVLDTDACHHFVGVIVGFTSKR